MKIKSLVIENFKSIERIELIEPNPFTVFVGPNGSGKSNIFEALEFIQIRRQLSYESTLSVFGGLNTISPRQAVDRSFKCRIVTETFLVNEGFFDKVGDILHSIPLDSHIDSVSDNVLEDYHEFTNYTRLFIKHPSLVKLVFNDDQRLSLSASNLEKVLKRILADDTLKKEIFEWLELFVPSFKSIEIAENPFDGKETLLWFEDSSVKPFTKDLISDGTYNILALLTAVYQSDDKPQFLCIEEPENGLHPQVAAELVDFFRIMCEERGHYIWLNTHSQSMASRVRPNEFVVVEKKDGATITRQFRNEDFNGMSVDEAWLTNALNGGLAW
jgi:predicted ATPase